MAGLSFGTLKSSLRALNKPLFHRLKLSFMKLAVDVNEKLEDGLFLTIDINEEN